MHSTAESPLSDRADRIKPSATLAMSARAQALRADGVDVLDLTAGQPDFPTPAPVSQAGIAAIERGDTRYSPAAGIPDLRAAVAEKLGEDTHRPFEPSQVLVSPGGKYAIAQALLALLNSGDEVLIPAPYWVSYPDMTELADGVPVCVPTRDGIWSVEEFENARTQRTRLLILNSPSNPSGVVQPREVIEAVTDWAEKNGIWILSDEIYARLTFDDDAPHVSPLSVSDYEQILWVGGVSKSHAMTGWRIGFLAGPAHVVGAASRIQSQTTSGACTPSQHAALRAVQGVPEEEERMRLAFAHRRDLVHRSLSEVPGIHCVRPQGAFYAFPRIDAWFGKTDPRSGRAIESADQLAMLLLEEDHVACVSGTPFGEPRCIRISFAANDAALREALQRIAARLAF